MGLDSTTTGGIEICADTIQYIVFTTTNTDFKGRMIYNTTTNDLRMRANSNATASFILNSTSSVTNGTTLQSRDQRLKFNKNH